MTDDMGPQVLRRDFLVGSAAGVAATSLAAVPVIGQIRQSEAIRTSYAQNGEDVIVALFLEQLNLVKPTYLDVGAYVPIRDSNTYLLYQKGSRGVLVEPNIALIPELRAERPGDIVLNVGVGETDRSEADYYCMTFPSWNTFDKKEAERRVAAPGWKVRIERVVKMPLISINRIMAEHFPPNGPDFLSIDIEALDLAVLRTIDFRRFRPKVICVETLVALTLHMDPEITAFLESHDYAVRGMTYANTIYLNKVDIV